MPNQAGLVAMDFLAFIAVAELRLTAGIATGRPMNTALRREI